MGHVDEALIRLRGRNIEERFGGEGSVVGHAGLFGDISDYADDGIDVLGSFNVAADGIGVVEELVCEVGVYDGDELRS